MDVITPVAFVVAWAFRFLRARSGRTTIAKSTFYCRHRNCIVNGEDGSQVLPL